MYPKHFAALSLLSFIHLNMEFKFIINQSLIFLDSKSRDEDACENVLQYFIAIKIRAKCS